MEGRQAYVLLLAAASVVTILSWLETSNWVHRTAGVAWHVFDPPFLTMLFNFALIVAIALLYRRLPERGTAEPAKPTVSLEDLRGHIVIQRRPEEKVPTIALATEWGIPRLRVNLAAYNTSGLDVVFDRIVIRVEDVELTDYERNAPSGPKPTFLALDTSLTVEQAQHLRELSEKQQDARIAVRLKLETPQGPASLAFSEWCAPITLVHG